MAQIEIINLSQTYAIGGNIIKAVDNVSLKIERGEFLSIVGHSGSGKTTLLSIIGGILAPSSGSVFFEGNNINKFNKDTLAEYRARRIGFIFQFASLLPVLTAKENLYLPELFDPEKRIVSEEKAVEYLNMVGLKDHVDAYPSQLSGGQQRRVAIARAFMNDPEIILADEPTGDLDEETEAEMLRLFKKTNEEKGITFIIVTHNTDLAKQTKRQLRMSSGSIYEL